MSEQSLNFARKGIKPASKLVILSIISVALMVLDNRYAAVQRLKGYTAALLYPLQWVANQPVQLYHHISDFMASQTELMAQKEALSQENGRLKMLVQQNIILQRELNELKTLATLQQSGLQQTIAAEVISNGKDPLSDKLIINKGTRQGLRTGDAVVDQQGLIGQITQAQPLSAELTLITNRQIVIPVMVARTGVRSLLYGSGSGVNLRYFPTDADLQTGDILLTSGLDTVYPEGIPVAKINSVSRANGTPYYKVSLTPLAHFRSSKYVLVLPQRTPAATFATPSDPADAATSAP